MHYKSMTFLLCEFSKRFRKAPQILSRTWKACITIIEIVFCQDRDPKTTIQYKRDTREPPILDLQRYGWEVSQLVVTTARYRQGVDNHNMQILNDILKLPPRVVKTCLQLSHLIAINSLTTIITNKKKPESDTFLNIV